MKRSTDSVKINQAARGSVRLRLINGAVLVLAAVIAAAMLAELHAMRQALARAGALDGPEAGLLRALLGRETALTVALLAVCVLSVVSVLLLVLRPLSKYIVQIRENRMLNMHGAFELRYLAEAYNLMVEENRKHNDSLRYLVEHDHLTGLLNRAAFDKLRRDMEHEAIALLLLDVDKFKEVNDTLGHETGDLVLQRVAFILEQSFRASDYPCRIGGDEFAVIMTDMNPDLREAVERKLDMIRGGLRDAEGDLPGVTLSVGVAFSRQCRPEDNIYRMADAALYRVKEAGRDGFAFFDNALDRDRLEKDGKR